MVYSDAPAGMKWCGAHGKYENIEDFPPGSCYCLKGKKAKNVIYNASKAAGQLQWLEEALGDPAKEKRLLTSSCHSITLLPSLCMHAHVSLHIRIYTRCMSTLIMFSAALEAGRS